MKFLHFGTDSIPTVQATGAIPILHLHLNINRSEKQDVFKKYHIFIGIAKINWKNLAVLLNILRVKQSFSKTEELEKFYRPWISEDRAPLTGRCFFDRQSPIAERKWGLSLSKKLCRIKNCRKPTRLGESVRGGRCLRRLRWHLPPLTGLYGKHKWKKYFDNWLSRQTNARLGEKAGVRLSKNLLNFPTGR